jgi:hypothetical protein
MFKITWNELSGGVTKIKQIDIGFYGSLLIVLTNLFGNTQWLNNND